MTSETEIDKYIKRLPLFNGLPESTLTALAKSVISQHLVKDEVLFRKGDPGDSLFMIRTGWVKITLEDADGDELVLNHCGPSEVIGEVSMLDGEPRSASVIALSPVEALELKRDSFLSVLQRQPLLALDVMRNMSSRLRYNTVYIEKAIELSNRVAIGDYSFALEEIQTAQTTFVQLPKSDETRASELLSAFFTMIEGVQKREDSLKKQLRELSIEIDEHKRKQDYEELTENTFFTNLKDAARKMREQQKRQED